MYRGWSSGGQSVNKPLHARLPHRPLPQYTTHTKTKHLEEKEKKHFISLVSLAQSDHAIMAEPANLTESGLMMIASGASARQHRIFVCKVS